MANIQKKIETKYQKGDSFYIIRGV